MNPLSKPRLLMALALCTAQAPRLASADAITRSVIAGGGTSSADGGSLALSGTIGQPATDTLSGGGYVLQGGFWPGAVPVSPPDAGPADAGAPDAGTPDAGAPDAGAADAGPSTGPTLTSITPDHGLSGEDTPVVLLGTRFESGTQVIVGVTLLSSINVASPAVIQAVVPHGKTPGTYDVVVVNPDGQQATLAQAYTILAGGSSGTTGTTGSSSTSSSSSSGTSGSTTGGASSTGGASTGGASTGAGSTGGTTGSSSGKKGCGCNAGPDSAAMAWVALLGFGASRRRRTTAG